MVNRPTYQEVVDYNAQMPDVIQDMVQVFTVSSQQPRCNIGINY